MTRQRQMIEMKTSQLRDPAIANVLLADVRCAGVWLALRLYLGWALLDAGWRSLDGPARVADPSQLSRLAAIAETLVGIALILGLFTGLAAAIGGVLSVNALHVSAFAMNPVLLIITVGLVLAWKTAGWFGLDRWLLPALGTPWHSGHVFRAGSKAIARSD